MAFHKKTAVLEGQSGSCATESIHAANYTTKQAKVLHHLTFIGSLNRFEAERIGDHCLHSTISTLRNDYDLTVVDEFESVPNRVGTLTDVKRYWIMKRNKAMAIKLLNLWRVKAKVKL